MAFWWEQWDCPHGPKWHEKARCETRIYTCLPCRVALWNTMDIYILKDIHDPLRVHEPKLRILQREL